jgi:cation transport ATPase
MTQVPDVQPADAPASASDYGTSRLRPGWAMPFGIISICYAAFGLLVRAITLAGNIFILSTGKPVVGFPPWYNAYETILGVGLLVLVGVLAAAGIQLIRWRPVARPLHLVWAVAMLVSLLVCGCALAAVASGQAGAAARAGMVIGGGIMLVLRVAYPVLVLIWFLRGKVREQMEALKGAGQAF